MFIPFEIIKGKEVVDRTGKKRKMMFKGVASNMDTGADMDGEILDPNGFDYTQFLKSGHINYNHMSSKDPLAIVGEPTAASVVDNKFIIEGYLYEESELAQKIYKAAEILEKSGSTRRLGFSIEGNAILRDPANKKLIKKAAITNVAIAPTPKNAGTSMELVKGLQFDIVKSVSDNIIVDSVSDGNRLLIDSNLNIDIVKSDSIVMSNDDFQKAITMVASEINKGEIVSGVEIIKSHFGGFRQILNGSLWSN